MRKKRRDNARNVGTAEGRSIKVEILESCAAESEVTTMQKTPMKLPQEDFFLSQAESVSEVGWDYSSPTLHRNSKMSMSVSDMVDIINNAHSDDTVDSAHRSNTPPMMKIWQESPQEESDPKTPKGHFVRTRGRRNKSRSETGKTSESSKAILQRLVAVIESKEDEKNCEDRQNSVRRSARLGQKPVEEYSGDSEVSQKNDTPPRLSCDRLNSNIKAFSSMSLKNPMTSPPLKCTTLDKLDEINSPGRSDLDEFAGNQSCEDLWTDEELFDNESFLKATQDLFDSEPFVSPKGMKRKSSGSTLDGTSAKKSGRYTFSLDPATSVNHSGGTKTVSTVVTGNGQKINQVLLSANQSKPTHTTRPNSSLSKSSNQSVNTLASSRSTVSLQRTSSTCVNNRMGSCLQNPVVAAAKSVVTPLQHTSLQHTVASTRSRNSLHKPTATTVDSLVQKPLVTTPTTVGSLVLKPPVTTGSAIGSLVCKPVLTTTVSSNNPMVSAPSRLGSTLQRPVVSTAFGMNNVRISASRTMSVTSKCSTSSGLLTSVQAPSVTSKNSAVYTSKPIACSDASKLICQENNQGLVRGPAKTLGSHEITSTTNSVSRENTQINSLKQTCSTFGGAAISMTRNQCKGKLTAIKERDVGLASRPHPAVLDHVKQSDRVADTSLTEDLLATLAEPDEILDSQVCLDDFDSSPLEDNTTLHSSCPTFLDDNTEDLLGEAAFDDDPLSEPQVLAMLEAAESQASQGLRRSCRNIVKTPVYSNGCTSTVNSTKLNPTDVTKTNIHKDRLPDRHLESKQLKASQSSRGTSLQTQQDIIPNSQPMKKTFSLQAQWKRDPSKIPTTTMVSVSGSGDTTSGSSKCSSDEINKKREEALKRRQNRLKLVRHKSAQM